MRFLFILYNYYRYGKELCFLRFLFSDGIFWVLFFFLVNVSYVVIIKIKFGREV